MAVALLAAVVGVLAAPSVLFVVACVLYVPAAGVIGGARPELRTLSLLGWEWRNLAGAVLAEHALIGVVAAIVAAPYAALGDTEAGAGPAAAIAFAIALAAGAACASTTTASMVPNADRSRLPS